MLVVNLVLGLAFVLPWTSNKVLGNGFLDKLFAVPTKADSMQLLINSVFSLIFS